MAYGYPVIERWRVDLNFLYQHGCWISSDREKENSSVFYISMAVEYLVVERWIVDLFFSIYVWLLDIQ